MANNKLFRYWKQSSMRDFHVTLAVIAVAAHMVGRLSKNENAFILADVTALVAIFHFFIHGYLYHQHKFLTDNQRVYSLPKKKIARIGTGFLAGFLFAVSVIMAMVKEIYNGTLIAKIKTIFLYLLGILFGTLLETDGLGKEELITQNNYDLLGALGQISAKADSPWEKVISGVQTFLIIIGVLFLVILCVAAVVGYVRRLVKGSGVRIKDERGREVADREERIRKKVSKRENILDFSPTAKARRIYRKYIHRQKRKGQILSESLTPAEIEKMVAMPEEEKYLILHQIYEKARYSEHGCTEEEAQQAKALKV